MDINYKIKYNYLGHRVKVVSIEGSVVYDVLIAQNPPRDTESREVEYDIRGDDGVRYYAAESEIKEMTVLD
ncbi:hypothetical protein [Fructobacillus evanidus]|uniref:Uncharacterized protein n=1 Tax=Fructobacillus evanidus TaxID=3064281 RepID=A0ABN9YL32_9LACO|nr:unnamed protein product [Fructobacillus sp. LMG 32999]CAK1222757.1 unnamed protein product [Fructobacillus sp. LMG 32999]CAK1223556.1 unnamed protein product [Fructobacillus sp. LMG 32999]CAK1223597.1 unnamed protein product [Fructobacillus sp. LMG 32999]CAK1223746.1 unnamed protein product [Fructobacillus sp. LMG 32999]